MQFQADLLGCPVVRPRVTETTALGAAYLAGLAVGYWRDQKEIALQWQVDHRFNPTIKAEVRKKLCVDWDRALQRAKKWAVE
jgi:glycerol kinase